MASLPPRYTRRPEAKDSQGREHLHSIGRLLHDAITFSFTNSQHQTSMSLPVDRMRLEASLAVAAVAWLMAATVLVSVWVRVHA